ncbi:DNA polymerase III epsilon subunit family exonuclease [Acholeplasma morum]|uniref:3'-5' exonuclease n=1 Tax=Paracholeplasma morum TaxID=264637 RepID=UPI00195BBE45|nr:3'-5' exonuclease [Paracholeplasma morum]MBM7453675.1 DNA polymerase III epsilon subunit family exonuclease [Paracholeplasma morum]
MLVEKYEKILLFDFETTGLYPNTDRIIEIGAILLKRDPKMMQYRMDKELSVLIRQNKPLPPKITEITNITDEMLLTMGISEEEAFQAFFDMYDEKTLLVAYNIAFDHAFLKALFRRQKDSLYELNNDLLDVMAMFKDRHPFPHKLDNAVSTYGVEVKNTHRAIDDIKATLHVLLQMIKERDTTDAYINVIGYNPKYPPRGPLASHVKMVPQYGNRLEIERMFKG